MNTLILSRWQFAITAAYHFLFVPLTLGLSLLVAVMETVWVRTGQEQYKKMARFWGQLFLVNFAMGVVTGIVQEFHFGMNWSEYARFMGDIFGAPLAMEALTAFFLESTFLGLWIFGWNKFPRAVHAACIWIVALASNLSSFWILVANSFMQSPVGYVINHGRAEMNDFVALLTNPYVWHQFPHTFLAGLVTTGVFVMAISAYHLLRQSKREFFQQSLRLGLIWALAGTILVIGSGHLQTQFLGQAQPMKLAAAEALWQSSDQAPFVVVAVIDEHNQTNSAEVSVPGLLSFLVHNSFTGEVKGMKDLQAAYTAQYGPGDYIPPVTLVFWSFRLMVLAGLWLVLLMLVVAYLERKGRLEASPGVLRAILYSLPVPYIANTCGWLVAEVGRQPWIVFGLQRVEQAVSPVVSPASVGLSLVGFTVIYGVLAVVAVYLIGKLAVRGPVEQAPSAPVPTAKGAMLWN